MNPSKMTMVVARYNENLDWLKELPWNYIVFNKGEDNLPKWIRNGTKLPNIGREAHTYLTYIIDNYDNLPEYIIFVQGDPFEHTKKLIEKINRFDGKHDFFTLSDWTLYAGSDGNPHHFDLKVGESVRKIFLNDNIKSFSFPKGAQFILSKKAILFHTKITYQKIIDFIMEGNSFNEACSLKKHERNCRCTSPFSAWIMERLWKTLFDNEHKTIYD